MNHKEQTDLLNRYLSGKTTPAEDDVIEKWLTGIARDDTDWQNKTPAEKELFVNELYARIRQTMRPEPRIVKMRKRPLIAAAVALFVLIGGVWLYNQTKEIAPDKEMTAITGQKPADITPGGNKAVLTLADGSTIILDSVHTGAISTQGSATVTKLNDGELSYRSSGNSPTTEIQYNTISTPRGGQYQLILSDGTKVWLNAESSLRYPAVFTGNERRVELTGEGYFEVAKNEKAPFYVTVEDMNVKVLGTHFNINAYKDEGFVRATLLEGSVQVEKNGVIKTINPGEQARVNSQHDPVISEIFTQQVNVSDVVAWKDGRFIFHNDNIESVMKQLARWYDITVTFEGNIPNDEFVGVINRSRYENISEILNMLERTRTVSFVIRGSNVTVKPYSSVSSIR